MSLNYQIEDTGELVKLKSPDYNFVFNRNMNTVLRWGSTMGDKPIWDPYGPEVACIDTKDLSMELYTVIVDTLSSNRTLTIVNLLNLVDDKAMTPFYLYAISKGLVVTAFPFDNDEEAGFFSVFVSNKGIIRPVSTYEDGIDIMNVNNLYSDVWQSPLFKKYRWEQLIERAKKE